MEGVNNMNPRENEVLYFLVIKALLSNVFMD